MIDATQISASDRKAAQWKLAQRQQAEGASAPQTLKALLMQALEAEVLSKWRLEYGAAKVTEARTVVEKADPLTVADQLPAIKTLLNVP